MTKQTTHPPASVIVPVHNEMHYLAETLHSLRDQTHDKIEIIIVDNGSTDETPRIIDDFLTASRGDDHLDVIVLKQEKRGEAMAVNAGWQAACGDYVAVVSADDPQPENWLADCVTFMQKHQQAIVGYPNWRIIGPTGALLHEIKLPPYDVNDLIIKAKCLPGPGSLIRKAALPIPRLRQEDLLYTSDYECWLSLALQGKFLNIPHVFANWRQHQRATTNTASPKHRAREYNRVVRCFFEREDLAHDLKLHKRLALSNACYNSARTVWRTHFWTGVGYLAGSLIYRIWHYFMRLWRGR